MDAAQHRMASDDNLPRRWLITGRMWVGAALDKLNAIDDPGYYEQEALILVEVALEKLNDAVRKLED